MRFDSEVFRSSWVVTPQATAPPTLLAMARRIVRLTKSVLRSNKYQKPLTTRRTLASNAANSQNDRKLGCRCVKWKEKKINASNGNEKVQEACRKFEQSKPQCYATMATGLREARLDQQVAHKQRCLRQIGPQQCPPPSLAAMKVNRPTSRRKQWSMSTQPPCEDFEATENQANQGAKSRNPIE